MQVLSSTKPRLAIAPDYGLTVPFGTTAQYTAIVTNDPPERGVSWSLSCEAPDCGSISPATSASGVAVTYTAPAAPPTGKLSVTVIATSVSDPSMNAVSYLYVPAVKVSATPTSALLPLNATQDFTAIVGNDPTDAGVNWTLTHDAAPCPTDCGKVSPDATASGSPTTYTAPGSLPIPAEAAVQVTAASVVDGSKSFPSTVKVTAGSVKLVPMDLRFGAVGNHKEATLTNAGDSTLTISDINFTGTNAVSFSQTNTCGNELPARASCTITVTFTPTGQGNARYSTAVLSISDSSADSPQQVALSVVLKLPRSAAMRDELGSEAVAAAPRPTGNSKVGTRVLHFVDSKRADPYLGDGTKRELMVRFWYPMLDAQCTPAQYTSPAMQAYVAHLLGVGLPHVTTNSCLDAAVALGAHPVVVVTHGFTGTSTDYTFLAEDLASRGYLVAAIDHTFEATAVEFPDGRLEKSRYGSYLTHYVRSDPDALDYAVAVRLDDLGFVLDELQRLDAGPGVFAGRLDLSHIGLAGHSLGGLTTVLGVERDHRFKAGVVLDGVMPAGQTTPIRTPLLIAAAGREQWNDNECRLWHELHGPRAAVNLPGAEHFAFSDAVWLARRSVAPGPSGADATIAAIRDYVAAFLDANLTAKGSSSLLAAPSRQHPDAVLTSSKQALCSEP